MTLMLMAVLAGPWNERMGSRGESMHPRGLDVKYSIAAYIPRHMFCLTEYGSPKKHGMMKIRVPISA